MNSALDGAVDDELDSQGAAIVPALLSVESCRELAACYDDADAFRSRIVMQRHGFGRGEYQYFRYPLPPLVAELRERLYGPLARIANRWSAALGASTRYPETLPEFLERCHSAGQLRPTPLLLRYRAGNYNCLHQDLYGEHVFPLQATVLLSTPGADFAGGEFGGGFAGEVHGLEQCGVGPFGSDPDFGVTHAGDLITCGLDAIGSGFDVAAMDGGDCFGCVVENMRGPERAVDVCAQMLEFGGHAAVETRMPRRIASRL